MNNLSWKTLIVLIIYFLCLGVISYIALIKMDFTKLSAGDVIQILDKIGNFFVFSLAGLFGYKWIANRNTNNKEEK